MAIRVRVSSPPLRSSFLGAILALLYLEVRAKKEVGYGRRLMCENAEAHRETVGGEDLKKAARSGRE